MLLKSFLLCTLILLVCVQVSYVSALEKPNYISLKKEGKFEQRHYPRLLLADVTVNASSLKEAGNKGFKVLSNYIFNNPEKKIKMTAPVIIEALPKSTYQITFVMPASYSLETLPKAETKAISFRELNDIYVVATTFKGKNKLSRFLNHEQACREYLLNSNLKPASPVLYAYYSPPFLPSFLRKYEVLYSYIPSN